MSSTPGSTGVAQTGDIRTYATILRRRKWSIIFVMLIVTGAALFVSVRQTPMYRSTSRAFVKPLSPMQILAGVSYNFLVSMPTEQQIVVSPEVAALAAEKAPDDVAAEGQTGSVSTSNPANTTFLDITYSAPDAVQAQGWANAYAQGYAQYRQDQAQKAYQAARYEYQGRMDALQKQLQQAQTQLDHATGDAAATAQARVTNLWGQVNALQQNISQIPFPSADATVVTGAPLPSQPYSPDYKRNLALALILGLIMGVSVAFIRERFDDRMAWRDDFEEALGAPCLSVIPSVTGWRRRHETRLVSRDLPKSPGSEAYRTVRTNLEFLAKSTGLRTFAVASPNLGEGKTTTTANLAVTLAQSGKRVIAISADLRKPRLHKFFDCSNDRGLTTILSEGASILDVVQRTDIPTLRIIASGPVPHDPANLLGTEAMDEVLEELRQQADYVVIDTAPLLAVSDCLALGPKADGVILVVDASKTTQQDVRVVREQLEQVGANIIGGIFNDFDPSSAKSYPGSYRNYYYGSGANPYGDAKKKGTEPSLGQHGKQR